MPRGGFVFALSAFFLSRVFSRERSLGSIVAPILRDNRDKRVRVLRAPHTSKKTRVFAHDFGFVYVNDREARPSGHPERSEGSRIPGGGFVPALFDMPRCASEGISQRDKRQTAESGAEVPLWPVTVLARSHRMNCAGPSPPNKGGEVNGRRGMEAVASLSKAKIENPLFSTTWWLRLCNIALRASALSQKRKRHPLGCRNLSLMIADVDCLCSTSCSAPPALPASRQCPS